MYLDSLETAKKELNDTLNQINECLERIRSPEAMNKEAISLLKLELSALEKRRALLQAAIGQLFKEEIKNKSRDVLTIEVIAPDYKETYQLKGPRA